MKEPGDYQLDPLDEHGTVDLADEIAAESRPKWPWIVAAVLILVLVGAWVGWRYFWQRPAPAPPAPAAAAPAEPAPEPVEQEAVDLPVLEESDPWLREVVSQLSEHPQLVTWLLNDDLITRLVAAVDNVAEGLSPRNHVEFLQPAGEFQVTETRDGLYVGPESYDRYDRLTAVITSLHVDGTAQVYRNVKPLLDEAYQELGYPGGEFDTVASAAVRKLLDTPVLNDVEVERFSASYHYADPRLENLDEAQKQFLRLGPENLLAIQNHVRRIARRAGLDVG